MTLRVERRRVRVAPMEYREAVEQWARQYGGHGDVVWEPMFTCWAIRLTLKPGDPRLKNPDEGEHFEQVLLHEWVRPDAQPPHPLRHRLTRRDKRNALLPSYVGFELDDLGVSGVLEILEKGSLMSGRGEFKSAQHALKVVMDRNRGYSKVRKNAAYERVQDLIQSTRRRRLKIPFLPVAIDLSPSDGASP